MLFMLVVPALLLAQLFGVQIALGQQVDGMGICILARNVAAREGEAGARLPAALRRPRLRAGRRDIAKQAQESQESSHRIHMALVWIEVFIVVVYASELINFFVIELPHIHDPYMRWTAGILAVGTGLVALGVLRPWDHKHEARRKHAKQEEHGKDAKAAG